MGTCPCCSGLEYDACCGPFLRGERHAPTAEALLRSRYTAYATRAVEYVRDTTHPKTRGEFDADAARAWSEGSKWLGLEIVSAERGQEGDSDGTMEFRARYTQDGEEQDHHEIASFCREGGRWYFVDGKFVGPATFRREAPKVGRNDPCPCGSGKKHKKCCGR